MNPNLQRFLESLTENEDNLVRQWLARASEGNAPDRPSVSDFSGDGFRNPNGHILKANLPVLFEALLHDRTPASYHQALDSVIRVAAVQDNSASEAVSFLFALKEIVRQTTPGRERIDPDGSVTSAFESRIDAMALRAFDIFMECRERLCEIRLNEVRRRTFVRDRVEAKFKDRADCTR